MSASNYIHLDGCTVKRVTEKAMLVVWEDEEIWLPLSQVADADGYEEGDEDATVSITRWIAEQKEIEVD